VTFDLHIWHAGSPRSCLKVRVVGQSLQLLEEKCC